MESHGNLVGKCALESKKKDMFWIGHSLRAAEAVFVKYHTGAPQILTFSLIQSQKYT